ncbi:class I SAM-dependent RNA methyltransferase [Pseudactinotalea sp. HY158]|uniref:class I SAM-dependent RNA methyltransferase n=1 Tax=Pseudactinotalea sp. HY158 TaxID=2654547 RepID=UPI00129C1FEE|nr:TRAM domain-containing protein [Pseudactinotalea sp. HY158]QGH69299.1 TRAM domain-containing protein [Pseudactinotalea sp. HY158]
MTASIGTPAPAADLTLRIAGPVHGGHCLARTAEGRVVFVRHGAPGELVRARLTDTGKVWRADAVRILEPSPDRVDVPWRAAGPGGVGAVELAHLSRPAQLRWKSEVIVDALRRIGGLDLPVTMVDPEPGSDGWGTRTRIRLACDADGRAGMHAHRSDRIVPLESMPLAVAALARLDVFTRRWPAHAVLTLVAPSVGEPVLLVDDAPAALEGTSPRPWVTEVVRVAAADLTYRVAAGGFWQSHRAAPASLAGAVLAAAHPAGGSLTGARVFDLYSGAGLFSLPLAHAVGPTGAVYAVEGDRRAAQAARRNGRGLAQLTGRSGDVARVLAKDAPERADVVVLDPPRTGAGRHVMARVVERRPERIVYVACDPAALARDLAFAAAAGYRADRVVGHDLFPHTHHVESIAVLRPASSE